MKKIRYNLAIILCCIFVFNTMGQDDSETPSSLDEISKEVYFAQITKKQNSNTWFPDLAYWGVQEINWSFSKADVENQTNFESKGLNIFSTNTTLFEKEFYEEITFSNYSNEDQLIQYALVFNSIDKKELLSLFNEIMAEANLIYHAPTTYINQPQNIDGKDGFLDGIISTYEVEWAGTRTKIILSLNKTKVSLVYLPVEGNDYSELEKLASKI